MHSSSLPFVLQAVPILSYYAKNQSMSEASSEFSKQDYFLWWSVLAPRLIPKLEDHPMSAVRDCLFNIFAATLHTWRTFRPSTWGRAIAVVARESQYW
jgi:hypothetical protein